MQQGDDERARRCRADRAQGDAALSLRITRDEAPGGPVIRGFSGAGFRIGEVPFPAGVMLTPDEAWEWQAPASLDDLTFADLESLLAIDPPPEFVLVGTGEIMRFLPALAKALEARGIGLEAMDSRAAARAWGVLRGEGRQVVAALMPTDR